MEPKVLEHDHLEFEKVSNFNAYYGEELVGEASFILKQEGCVYLNGAFVKPKYRVGVI